MLASLGVRFNGIRILSWDFNTAQAMVPYLCQINMNLRHLRLRPVAKPCLLLLTQVQSC